MPRSTKSKGVTATLEREDEDTDVTTATEEIDGDELETTDPRFEFESLPAPEGFTPERKTPGRVRQPSYFDDILRREDVFETGKWQMVPVTSKEHADAVYRELNRAKLWLNKEGLAQNPPLPEIGLDLDEREDAYYYRSRTAQKRERKNGSANGAAEVDVTESDEFEAEAEE